MRLRTSVLVVTVVVGLVLAGCGDDDEPTSNDDTTTTADADDGAPDAGSSATEPGDDGSTTQPGERELPGERVDIYPYEGAALAVVGVASDDELNVRAGPGTGFEVRVALAPLAQGLVATGHNRTLDDGGFWAEVDVDGEVGWANVAYLAQAGQTRDITSEVDIRPEGSSPADIGLDVAGQRAGDGEGPTPTITVVDQDGTSAATVDLIGLGDDAQKGERLHVVVAGGTVTVEATALCARGVTDGLCT